MTDLTPPDTQDARLALVMLAAQLPVPSTAATSLHLRTIVALFDAIDAAAAAAGEPTPDPGAES